MHEDSFSVPVVVPNAPASLVPRQTGVMVVGSVELTGVLSLEGTSLVLDYQVQVTGVEMLVTGERIEIPLEAVSMLRVQGGWWRPVLEVHARQPSAFAPLGLDRSGCVRFRIPRAQRLRARELAASTALRAAEQLGGGPRHLREGE